MSGLMRLFTMGAEHASIQAKIDAARVKQKAHNDAELSLVESKKIIQAANNAASEIYAGNARKVQGANNTAAQAMADGRTLLRDTGNTVNHELAEAQRHEQAVYNEQAIILAEAKRTVQAARNERAAANSSLAQWSQSLKNQRVLEEAGTKAGEIVRDVSIMQDRALTSSVFGRLEASQMLGAAVAQAAAANVGGSSVDLLKTRLSMRQALNEQTMSDDVHSKALRAYRERGNIMQSAAGSLDYTPIAAELDYDAIVADQNYDYIGDNQDLSPIFAQQDYSAIVADHDFSVFTPDIDYTVYQDHKKMSNLQAWLTFNTAGVATYFGGPAAGEAVVDASIGLYDGMNGNMQSAQQYMDSAFKGAVTGIKTFRAGADATHSGTPWGQSIAPAVSKFVSNVGASLHL